MSDGWRMGRSTAWNGASSKIAACSDRQPMSWLWAITRFWDRRARPCVSRAVKTELGGTITAVAILYGSMAQRGYRGLKSQPQRADLGKFLLYPVRSDMRLCLWPVKF